jgi:hypothetical protein
MKIDFSGLHSLLHSGLHSLLHSGIRSGAHPLFAKVLIYHFHLHFGRSQRSKLLVRAQVLGPWGHYSDDFVRAPHGKDFNSGGSGNTN